MIRKDTDSQSLNHYSYLMLVLKVYCTSFPFWNISQPIPSTPLLNITVTLSFACRFGVEADSDDAGSEDDQGKPADLPISSESIGTLEDSSGPQEDVTADDQEDKQVEQETEQMTHLQNCASNPDGQKGCSDGDSKLQSQTDVSTSYQQEEKSEVSYATDPMI